MHPTVLRQLTVLPVLCTFALAGHVSLDIQRTRGLQTRALSPRDAGSIGVDLIESQLKDLYMISLSIGTPPQPFNLQLDTGSSDLWVPWAGAQACIGQGGCPGGDFRYNASSTFDQLFNNFSISYGDGTGVSGDYFTDTVQLGSATVQNFTMGLALNTTNGPKVNNSGQGLLGVAYPSGETGFLQTGFEFPTIYEAMVSQGLIARSAYSLYLDDREIGKGAVLFGGVDSSKYTGDLTVLPLQPNVLKGGVVDAFIVGLTDVFYEEGLDKTSLTGPGYQGEPADLDSGTTQAYIPDEAYNNLVQGLGAYISPDTGNTLLPCDMPTGNASLSFQFGGNEGIEMAVPLSTLLIQDQDAMEQLPDGTNGCQLGVLPASDIGGGVILGDAFLRSFYVVYDVANDQVAIATAALNATATGSVTPIPTGTSIPGASSTATLILPTVQSNNSGSTSTPSAITSVTGSATFTDLPTAAAVVTSARGTKGSSASASASAIPSGSSSGATNVDVRGFGGLVVFLMTLSALLSF